MTRHTRTRQTRALTGRILRGHHAESAAEHLVTGVVLEPDVADTYGTRCSAATIRAAAHRFLARYGRETRIGHQHRDTPPGLYCVESWVTREDTTWGDQVVRAGSWLMTVRVLDPELWRRIEEGGITGLSIGATATLEEGAQ